VTVLGAISVFTIKQMGTPRERLLARAAEHGAARQAEERRAEEETRTRIRKFGRIRGNIGALAADEGGVTIRSYHVPGYRQLPAPEADDQVLQPGATREPWRYKIAEVGNIRLAIDVEATPDGSLKITWSSTEDEGGQERTFADDDEAFEHFIELLSAHVIGPEPAPEQRRPGSP
jgi:hypothetical protein